ncbi:diguanylate cyclase domain-containing protein [Pseudomonas argentinensis]|uniref:diguanylate cyclase domain-containing protein n=1 Tax=Phytopseudomonas argentinensis TaxID=289370 RepID=UPI0008A9FDB4|nr:GGDEF domain-containing protein [Pseudomonas argentinensis]
MAVFSDISVLEHSQQELDYRAHHDLLSTLPNRLLLSERVEHTLPRAQRDDDRGAVQVVDLDHFKHINESLGHNVGELLPRPPASGSPAGSAPAVPWRV